MQEISRAYAVVWMNRIQPCACHDRLGNHLGSYRHEVREDRFYVETTKGSIPHDVADCERALLATQEKKSLFVHVE